MTGDFVAKISYYWPVRERNIFSESKRLFKFVPHNWLAKGLQFVEILAFRGVADLWSAYVQRSDVWFTFNTTRTSKRIFIKFSCRIYINIFLSYTSFDWKCIRVRNGRSDDTCLRGLEHSLSTSSELWMSCRMLQKQTHFSPYASFTSIK